MIGDTCQVCIYGATIYGHLNQGNKLNGFKIVYGGENGFPSNVTLSDLPNMSGWVCSAQNLVYFMMMDDCPRHRDKSDL